MPFYFHNKERLQKHLTQLQQLRYRQLQDITEFTAIEDLGGNGVTKPPKNTHRYTIKLGDYWKSIDSYLWICTEIVFPKELEGKDIIGLFDFGKTDFGGNGFESLLYVNGEHYQAMDQNHKEVFFDNSLAGHKVKLEFRAWSGLDDGQVVEVEHKIRQAQIGFLDKDTDEFYYMMKNILETVEELNEDDPNQTWLMNLLVSACNKIDYSNTGSDEFYDSMKEANTFINNELQGQDKMNVSVSLIGHTHIDVAWLWRLTHTREKCARSFSTVNRLMERYDDYQFLQSQAQLYDYMKHDYPTIYEQIKARVKQGKWEPAGSMWVECDCNLTSGESIVRQILYGKRFFEKEFGYENDYLWLPDVFGYSWALPQILKKSGINTFVTTKISWNDTNKIPYDTFIWRGMDNSEVTTHFITSPEHSANRYYTYNGIIDPYMVKGVWSKYSNKDLNTDMLIAYGYGDGGGGVNRDMLENLRCIKKLPGLPTVKSEHATQYLRRLNQTIKENKRNGYVPIWDGELYLEFHRGTYTSQAYNKRKNRELEFLIRNAEMIASFAMCQCNMEYPAQKIYEAWKIIMRQQFHDVIPGSSIKEVYDDCREEYQVAQTMLQEVISESSKAFVKQDSNHYTVMNTLNWTRDTVVFIDDCKEDTIFADENGEELPSFYCDNVVQVLVRNIEPLSMRTICRTSKTKSSVISRLQGNQIETAYYTICWNDNGHITSIYDKNAKRELIAENQYANVFEVFEDKPRQFDAWEMESTFENKMEIVNKLVDVNVYSNEIGIFVTFDWEYRNSTISQTLKAYHENARIDFETTVQWHEREKLMKVSFPVDIRATQARYDIQYGNISRPITRNTTWEAAKYEVVAHKWADLSESGYGVALLNDCKYGHDIKNNVMRLTLLKSSNYPDKTADYGEHIFTYAILPHMQAWYESDLEQQASDLNNKALLFKGTIDNNMPKIMFDKRNIAIDAIKKAEDDNSIIVRFHEFAGAKSRVKLMVDEENVSWCSCNLMEKEETCWSTEKIDLVMHPYEIKTLKIKI